jgi:rubrerythrin
MHRPQPPELDGEKLMENQWDFSDVPAEQLFEMAAIIEQAGFDFYARLIARTSDPRVMKELKFLRDEEAVHKAFFLGQLRYRGIAPKGELDPGQTAFLEREFLEPLDGAYRSPETVSADATLAFGAFMEQKTIDFYRSLMAEPSVADGVEDIERIVGQEEAHRRRLELIRAR